MAAPDRGGIKRGWREICRPTWLACGPQSIRRVPESGDANLGRGDPDGCDIRLHSGHPGVVRGDVYFWSSMMGACLIVSVPVAIVYNLFVDRSVVGLTAGAIK